MLSSVSIDTIDHKILLRKLKCYGVDGDALLWFGSYLTNRKGNVMSMETSLVVGLLIVGSLRGLYWVHFCF